MNVFENMVAITWLYSVSSNGKVMEQRKVGKVERAEIKSKKAAEESESHLRKAPPEEKVEVVGEPTMHHQKKITVHEPEQSRGR
jgi:hypothetical protein